MSSAVDIQVVSPPNLEKIENFFKDVAYRETIEVSANFNTRLCIERRLRMPFLDPQTGVAQSHSHLFMSERQRMPGFRQGQIYTYPAARWRKSRRQYLNKMYRFSDRPFQSLRKEQESLNISTVSLAASASSSTSGLSANYLHDPEFNGSLMEESSSLGAAGGDTSDSKDSQHLQHLQQQHQHFRDDLASEWFYEDIDINDVDSLEEPKSPADDEYDYDPRYGAKKRKKRPAKAKTSKLALGEVSNRRRSGIVGGVTVGGIRARGGSTHTPVLIPDGQVSSIDTVDVGITLNESSPTTSGGRRVRGTNPRGRRRTKPLIASPTVNSPTPSLIIEPPSFASAAAAMGVVADIPVAEEHDDSRNYRKYL